MIRTLVAFVVAAALLWMGAPTEIAVGHGTQDQALETDPGCVLGTTPPLRTSAPSSSALRQEVVPALPGLTGVDLCITASSSSILNLQIRSGTAAVPGSVLAAVSGVAVTSGTKWVHVELSAPIATPPGEMFVIEITGFPAFSWRGTCGTITSPDCPTVDPDLYTPGVSSASPTVGDFGFRTFDPGDSDFDGMPDGYELLHDCLDRLVHDATADPDVDAISNLDEYLGGTDPCIADANPDADGDGCTAAQELGSNPAQGGDRDPASGWDFYDVPVPALLPSDTSGARNKAIGIPDTLAVLAYSGASDDGAPLANGADYNSDHNSNGVDDGIEYDRTPSTVEGKPWRSGPPNGNISIQDVLVSLTQAGHSCA